jgi:hypothetical protein
LLAALVNQAVRLKMRVLSFVLATTLSAFLYGDDVHISPRFQTVYILEMSNALDQHLASRLTATRVLWVVLDPASADAVLTESLDDSFQSWMRRTYAAAPGAPATDASDATQRRTGSAGDKNQGTVFLVDPRRRIVLWSACELPKNSSAAEADRTAARLANELKLAFGKK